MSDNRGGMRDSGRGYPDGGGGGSGSGGRGLDRDRSDRDRSDRDRGDRDRGDRDRGRDRHDYYGGGGGGDRDRDRYSRGRSRSRSRSPPSRRDGGGGGPYGSSSHLGGQAPMIPGMVPGVLPGMMANAGLNLNLMAQDKVMRELFVGNTPPGTSEALLREFLNGAMRRVRLCDPNHTPIVTCRVNSKFAFVECTSVEDTNKALNLNGIPFLGSCLKVSRPSKYMGPLVPAKTWQELTGQPLPANVMPLGGQADDKINRELFIGNTLPEMTDHAISEFLGKAMEQVGLSTAPGNPIVACRLSGKFAFVEMRSKEEAANALNLNNIPFLGSNLRVGRPAKYTGPQTPHGNWEDILAKYMSGELKLPSQGGQGAAAVMAPAPAPAEVTSDSTKVVMLQNMLGDDDLEVDEEYQDIMEDTKEECGTFGTLVNIEIPRTGPGKGKIYLEYKTREEAANAIQQLGGRTFDGKKVEATYFAEDNFAKKEFA